MVYFKIIRGLSWSKKIARVRLLIYFQINVVRQNWGKTVTKNEKDIMT